MQICYTSCIWLILIWNFGGQVFAESARTKVDFALIIGCLDKNYFGVLWISVVSGNVIKYLELYWYGFEVCAEYSIQAEYIFITLRKSVRDKWNGFSY